MTDSPRQSADPRRRRAVDPPAATLLPGVALLFLGLWLVTDGGPLPLGWACFAVGLAMTIVGAVAKGVAWGLALHADARG